MRIHIIKLIYNFLEGFKNVTCNVVIVTINTKPREFNLIVKNI